MIEKDRTNMASEFYVFSILHRIGANAFISLGNKKSIDIIVDLDGKALTIDVKGLRSTGDFIINDCKRDKNHYIAFVYYSKGSFENPNATPEVYIVPSKDINDEMLSVPRKNVENVPRSKLEKYKDNWKVFTAASSA